MIQMSVKLRHETKLSHLHYTICFVNIIIYNDTSKRYNTKYEKKI